MENVIKWSLEHAKLFIKPYPKGLIKTRELITRIIKNSNVLLF